MVIWVSVFECRPKFGVRGGPKFMTIRVGNMLAMWAVIRIMWTSLYRWTMTKSISNIVI